MATGKRLVLLCAAVFAAFALRSSSASAGLCGFCGGNAATVGDGVLFDELNVKKGVHRPGKPWIEHVTLNNDPVTLEVMGDHLVAIDPKLAPSHIEGGRLLTLQMIVKVDDGRTYGVRLTEVAPTNFWVGPPSPSSHSYVFEYWKIQKRDPKAPKCDRKNECKDEDVFPLTKARPVCSYVPQAEEKAMGWNSHYKLAMTFAGDRFKRDHSVKEQEPGWFNLACYGTAAAKMHLLRHTQASSIPGFETTLDQRTAMLRAITADYCSDGKSRTGDGTPLYWTDKRQWFPLQEQVDAATPKIPISVPLEGQVEAAWGDRGQLLCLNEPRRTPAPVVNLSTCTAPAVVRADVTRRRFCRQKDLSTIQHCNALVGSSQAASPWNANRRLAKAYVLTVNRPRIANYCH